MADLPNLNLDGIVSDLSDIFGDIGDNVLDAFDDIDFNGIELGNIDLDNLGDRLGDVFDDITNTKDGSAKGERIKGNNQNNRLNGKRGKDTLLGLGGNDILSGGRGDDILVGGPGSDVLSGEQGNDDLQGGLGGDFLYGGSGDDLLTGGNGNDLLSGGDGKNTLDGGAGRDIYVLDDEGGVATIQGFRAAQEKIALSQDLSFQDLVIGQQGANVTIRDDKDLLAVLNNTQAASITANNFITIAVTNNV